ncbi:MAG: CvpA family protein [Ignavibacteriota bacterium]
MIIDLIVAGLLLVSLISGWRKGALTMIATIVVLLGSILLATAFGTQAGKILGFGPTLLHPVIGFFVVFLLLLIAGSFLKKFIKPKRGLLAGADKIIGSVFGLVRAFLLIGLLFGFLRIFQFPSATMANKSTLYPIILKPVATLVSQLRPLASQLSGEVYDEVSPSDSLR